MDNVSRALLAAGGGSSGPTDPLRNYVTLLLKSEGPANSNNNTFLDSSTNAFTITRNGNTTQGTFSPFGDRWSNYFDGSGDQLVAPDNAAFAFGTGDFTVEAWAYPTVAANQTILANMASSADGNAALWIYVNLNGAVIASTWSSTLGQSSNGVVLTNAWNHIAMARSGTTASVWVNGTRVLNFTLTNDLNRTTGYRVGAYTNAGTPTSVFTGYIADARVVKGTAVYSPSSTTITVPTALLTAISGTSLLTCQANRLIDSSVNNFTITRNGDVSVQRFSPFAPTAAYSAGAIGGSGYFDGSGDYLSIPDNASWVLGNNFTVECWVYFTSTSGIQQFVNQRASSANAWQFLYNFPNSGDLTFKFEDGNVAINRPWSPTVGQWYHIAATRSGSTWYLHVNGVQLGATATNSTTFPDISASVWVGTLQNPTGESFVGYMTDVRVTRSSVYTSNFTPPTAPLTAITNTALLLNFTNAGVFDDAMLNNLETVGNAQISTTGGGSMAFDGTDDRLTAINRENFNFGTGDFTVEFWINASASGTYTQVVGTLVSGTEAGTWRIGNRFNTTNAVYFARGNGSGFDEFNAAVNVNDGAWHHVAVTRASGTARIFVDGTQVASSSITGTCSSSNPLTIGYNQRDNTYVTGYIDDVRITKGVARYTSNFTRPSDLPSI